MHIDLDGAWAKDTAETYVDCQTWGRRLRYCATAGGMNQFYEFIKEKTARFTLFGSGDFHHLTALWLRKLDEPVTLVSFDNHPDWDIRPPRWGCGTWINRALELPMIRRAVIWGCGNFELNWPGHWFVSRKALRSQRLEVWPWTERLKASGRKRWPGMTRENWREKFQAFAAGLAGGKIYVTIDLDCLDSGESATNWENGLFKIADIEWALDELRARATIVGGDLCGAYSHPRSERWMQRLASHFDHSRLEPVSEAATTARNGRALQALWSALRAI